MSKIIVGYECLKCFVSQIDKILNELNFSEKQKINYFLKTINFLTSLSPNELNYPPPEIASRLYSFFYKLINNDNPYKEIKEKTNLIAQEVLEILKQESPSFSIEKAIKYAVAGNIIDFGIANIKNNFNVKELSNFVKKTELHINHTKQFKNMLENSKSLLYILDNSGEVIFDKFLIENIKLFYPNLKIIIATRGSNIINDISFEDAIMLGLNQLGEVISTGYNGPGVLIQKTSKQFKKIYDESDIILAKGQGNFETLFMERNNTFFALKIKCPFVSKKSGFPLNSNIFVLGEKND